MTRKIILILYISFSILTMFVFAMLLQTIAKLSNEFNVDFILFNVSNPILLLSVALVTIIIGCINLIIPTNDSENISTFKITEEKATEIRAEEINEEIKNKYLEHIEEIEKSISQKAADGKNKKEKIEKALWSLCKDLEVSQGLLYNIDKIDGNTFNLEASYAFIGNLESINRIESGMGVSGQVIKNREYIYLKEVPKGYMKIISGLGETSPDYLLIIPVKNNEKTIGLAELAGLGQLNNEEVKTIVGMVDRSFPALLTKN